MIGTDIVFIPRFRKTAQNAAFVERVFTDAERAYCAERADPTVSLAGLFCAKEAAVKAFGSGFRGGIEPHDVEILHTEYCAPQIVLHGAAAEEFCNKDIEVSISHDGDYAVATVLLL